MFKKPRPPVRSFSEARSSKAADAVERGAYTIVRERDKEPRMPLADFFNILFVLFPASAHEIQELLSTTKIPRVHGINRTHA